MSTQREIREQMVLACKRAYTRGIQTGSGGNISARVPGEDLMLVKVSGSSFVDCTPEDFITTDFSGTIIEGKGKPTREALLHGLLYTLNPSVHAVLHVHSPYSISLANIVDDEIPKITWHSQLKIKDMIPIVDIPYPMVRKEDFPIIQELMINNPDIRSFVLKNHGIVVMDSDAIQAEHMAELVEETSQITLFKMLFDRMGART